MTVLSYSYLIIMGTEIIAPGHANNVVDGLNAKDNRYLKGKFNLLVKLSRNNISKIEILSGASKDIFVKFVDQCIPILN